MMGMTGGRGRWGVMVVVVLLLFGIGSSAAIWSGNKEPETGPSATEAAKEYAREAVRNTADAANNVGESIKQTANAAYETVTGGKTDSGATGAAYRDRAGNYISDAAGAVRDTAANAAQATQETLENAKERVWGVPEPEPSYSQRAADAARSASQNVREGVARAYDATAAPFSQEDTRGVYERTRDKVWGPPEPEPTYSQRAADAARWASQSVRDGASRAYDATAAPFTQEDNRGVYERTRDRVWGPPEPEPTYAQRAADAASQSVREGASRAYEATFAPFAREDNRGVYERTRDTVWGPPEPEPTYTRRSADAVNQASRNVRDGAYRAFSREDTRNYYERARDSASRAGQATRDRGYRAMGYEPPSEKTYASRAYDSIRDTSSDAYESGKSRLGSIVEILGWSRVPEDEQNYGPMSATLGNYHSPYDVMVGSTRYVWGKRPEEPKSYYETAADSMTKAKEATTESASRASESVKEAVTAGAAAVGVDQLVKDGFFRRVWRFVHLLTWGVALGTAVWMTFMSGRVLQQNMPREQFRTVQTKLFPSYMKFLTVGEGVLAFLYFFLSNSSNWQTFNLLFLAGTTAYNAYVLEPQTTKIYLDRLRLEKEEGKGLDSTDNVSQELDEKNQKFKELHGYSATLNLLSLAGLTYHAWNMVTRVYV